MKTAQKKSLKKGRILASVHITPPQPTRENVDPQGQRQRWEFFFIGSSNTYINDLAKRKLRSPTHAAVLKSKLVFTKGNGFVYKKDDEIIKLSSKQQKYVDNVNSKNETLFDVYKKVQGDFIDFGNAYLEKVKTRNRINPFHRDATTVRVGKGAFTDKAYISSFWRDIRVDPVFPRNDEFPIKEIDLGKGAKSLTHIKNYEAEYSTYGIVDHAAALKDADIEYKVSTFNLDKLENGFFPSAIIQLFGDPPEGKTPLEYVNGLKNTFTGEGNGRKMLVQLLEANGQKAEVHEFGSAQTGEFETLKKLAKDSIVEAHRWHPALLMQTAGKLSNNSEIRTAYELVKNTVIPDYREPVLRQFNKLLEETELFEGITLDIKPLVPVSMIDKVDIQKIWTIDEQREVTGKDPHPDKDIGENLIKGGNVNITSE